MANRLIRSGLKPSDIKDSAILEWLDACFDFLSQTDASSSLKYREVDLLQTLRAHLMLGFKRYCQNQLISSGHTNKRIPGASLLRKAKHLITPSAAKASVHPMSNRTFSEADVLFLPVESNHIDQHAPVSVELTKIGIKSGFITQKPRMASEVIARNLPHLYTLETWGNELDALKGEVSTSLSHVESIQFEELPDFPYPLNLSEIKTQFRLVFDSILPESIKSIAVTDWMIARFAPKLIVVGYSVTLHGAACALRARELGVETACIMHGNVVGHIIHKYHTADHLQVFGKSSADFVKQLGINPDRITVCGAPYLDSFEKPEPVLDSRIVDKLRLDRQKPIVLILSSGPGTSISKDHHNRFIENVMKASIEFPDVQFISKLHQKDRIEYYKSVAKKVPDHRLKIIEHNSIGFPTSIFDWLKGADAIVTGGSTTAVEAMLMGVRVITVDFAGELENVDFINDGATVHSVDYAQFTSAVKHFVLECEEDAGLDGRVEKFLKAQYYKLDGQSSRRVAEAL